MNSSAGVAFSPHVVSIGAGEVCYILCSFKFLGHLICNLKLSVQLF
jgi:hypothetical protein